MLTPYSGIVQNAPFRSQIFTIFFASSGKGALTAAGKVIERLGFVAMSMRDRLQRFVQLWTNGLVKRDEHPPTLLVDRCLM